MAGRYGSCWRTKVSSLLSCSAAQQQETGGTAQPRRGNQRALGLVSNRSTSCKIRPVSRQHSAPPPINHRLLYAPGPGEDSSFWDPTKPEQESEPLEIRRRTIDPEGSGAKCFRQENDCSCTAATESMNRHWTVRRRRVCSGVQVFRCLRC